MPAEHLINGERMSLELQLSYKSKDDKDLILSIMFQNFTNESQISA
jgi:carbonic anhydrase